MLTEDIEKLRSWFLNNCRDLPWRTHPDPYAVWVSEIMLQQTQVAVVVPYFERWMQRFPSIASLAEASLESVIKEWEGLGYYSRARNLHEGARYVTQNHNGILPSSTEELAKIKGLGNYTIGAIQSFAFHQRKAAVDGNVLRVLARYYGISEDISKSKTIKHIQALAQSLLPEYSPWTISEALIELGATLCSKKAKCTTCPLNKGCIAYAEGKTSEIPHRSPRIPTTALFRAVAIIQFQNQFLVKCGAKGRIMSDLYEFPYFEWDGPDIKSEMISKRAHDELGLKIDCKHVFEVEKHSFTRYRASLYPHLFTAKHHIQIADYTWMTLEELHTVPFSSGHRRILFQLTSAHIN